MSSREEASPPTFGVSVLVLEAGPALSEAFSDEAEGSTKLRLSGDAIGHAQWLQV